tara:strand:- start:420 stop:644 length:225 start_codon:yes stop_codon:yes gene_type:complete
VRLRSSHSLLIPVLALLSDRFNVDLDRWHIALLSLASARMELRIDTQISDMAKPLYQLPPLNDPVVNRWLLTWS